LRIKYGDTIYTSSPSIHSSVLEAKLLESFTYIQIFALGSIKFSALFFYHRIFTDRSGVNLFDSLKITAMVLVALWTVGMIIMNSLQCGTHLNALWTSEDAYFTYCATISPKYQEASALSNVLLDVLILVLPLPKIFGLHTTLGRKFAISGVFLLAAVGLGASIARTVAIFQIVAGLSPSSDVRLQDSLQVFWSMLEAGMSLLAINLPSLWAYHTHIAPEGVIASIRSVISLHSLRSLRSNGSKSRTNTNAKGMQPLPGDSNSLHSESSMANFVSKISPADQTEAYAMYDVEAQKNGTYLREGVIVVDSSVSQNNDLKAISDSSRL